MVSFDLNYRRNLWKWGTSAPEVLAEMIRVADIAIGNEEHLRIVAGIEEPLAREALTERMLSAYPHLKALAVSLRDSTDSGGHSWSACLNDGKAFLMSRRYEITHIVDRIGAGDAFAAGLIYGWTHLPNRQEALDFAVAASCLKHSIPGDFCRATVEEVHALLKDARPGQILR
jgi:2-dehydro-3-deoxygluconokinase